MTGVSNLTTSLKVRPCLSAKKSSTVITGMIGLLSINADFCMESSTTPTTHVFISSMDESLLLLSERVPAASRFSLSYRNLFAAILAKRDCARRRSSTEKMEFTSVVNPILTFLCLCFPFTFSSNPCGLFGLPNTLLKRTRPKSAHPLENVARGIR